MNSVKKFYAVYGLWVLFCLFYLGRPLEMQSWQEADLYLMIFSSVGLFLYVFDRSFVQKIFWKCFFILLVMHDFYWRLCVDSFFQRTWPEAEVWLWMISFLPLYHALYLYAFDSRDVS